MWFRYFITHSPGNDKESFSDCASGIKGIIFVYLQYLLRYTAIPWGTVLGHVLYDQIIMVDRKSESLKGTNQN